MGDTNDVINTAVVNSRVALKMNKEIVVCLKRIPASTLLKYNCQLEMEISIDGHEKAQDNPTAGICIKCKKRMTSNKSDIIFKIYCDECFCTFKKERDLEFVAEKEKQLIVCDFCFDSYKNMQQLQLHDCTRKDLYNCYDCGQQLEKKKSMIEHAKIVHQDKYWNKRIVCYICWKHLSSLSSFNMHIITHVRNAHVFTDQGDGKLCSSIHYNQNFSPICKLMQDMANYKDKTHKCSTCKKCFSCNSSLVIHMRTHTGERPYKCSTCQKSFSQSGQLFNHMRTHTGERPYKCCTCQKSFSRNGHLFNHMRSHTGEKPYKCCTCQKSFSHNRSLVIHVRTHTGERPYKCCTCQKSFSRRNILIRHLRTHTGERPYNCSTCQKSFSRRSSLIIHMRTRTGERPYTCSTFR